MFIREILCTYFYKYFIENSYIKFDDASLLLQNIVWEAFDENGKEKVKVWSMMILIYTSNKNQELTFI